MQIGCRQGSLKELSLRGTSLKTDKHSSGIFANIKGTDRLIDNTNQYQNLEDQT